MDRPIRLAPERPGPAVRGAMVVGLGLIVHGAVETRALARRVLTASTRVTARSVWLTQVTTRARLEGEATVAAARAGATALAFQGVRWVQTRAIPQFVGGMLPPLLDRVVPPLLDGALPEVRSRVLPALIEDLTHDERIRELVLHGGERAVSGAAQHLRSATAGADDRVENAVRQFRRRKREQ